MIMWVLLCISDLYILLCTCDYLGSVLYFWSVHCAMNLWLCEFCFASVFCTFCVMTCWVTETIEYRLGMSTFAVYTLIPELSLFWTVWGWFSITHCVVFFSYCVYFMCSFRWYRLSILRVWTIFYIRCTFRRIEGRCCRNLHIKYLCNNW